MTATLVFGDVVRSGAELETRAAALAGGLAASGLTEGDVVAALLPNDPVCIDLILACRLAGTYYCALNWHLAPAEIAFILADSQARLLLADPELVQPEADLPVLTIGVVYEAWLARQTPYAGPLVSPRAHMAYTSGTTGRPKGVRRLPVSLAEWPAAQQKLRAVVRQTMGLAPGGRALMPAPLYHSAPSVFAQNALQLCDLFVLMPRFDAEQTLALIERHRIDTIYLVPIMYSRLLALPAATRARYDVSSLRFVASTGAPCAPQVKQAIIDWFGPVVYETYASSEAGMVTVANPDEALQRPGTAGRPVGPASIRILAEDGASCPPGVVGQIYVHQPAYPDFTYNNLPGARAAIEWDGYVTLGDMGYLDADGYLFVSDRASDMVISGGVNIYPAEVEHALRSLPEIADCAVFGVPDAEYGERLHAVLQCAPGTHVAAEAVIQRLRGQLAGFKIPRSISFMDALPRDANGKLAKRHLRAPFWAAAGRQI
jgi:long-chain acyl-CoA synthetase